MFAVDFGCGALGDSNILFKISTLIKLLVNDETSSKEYETPDLDTIKDSESRNRRFTYISQNENEDGAELQ